MQNLLDYKRIENIEELSSLFKRKKENQRIKNIHNNNATIILVKMLDDKTKALQGAAVIGVENGMWGVCALRVSKDYRKQFMDIIDDNVPYYLFDNEIE